MAAMSKEEASSNAYLNCVGELHTSGVDRVNFTSDALYQMPSLVTGSTNVSGSKRNSEVEETEQETNHSGNKGLLSHASAEGRYDSENGSTKLQELEIDKGGGDSMSTFYTHHNKRYQGKIEPLPASYKDDDKPENMENDNTPSVMVDVKPVEAFKHTFPFSLVGKNRNKEPHPKPSNKSHQPADNTTDTQVLLVADSMAGTQALTAADNMANTQVHPAAENVADIQAHPSPDTAGCKPRNSKAKKQKGSKDGKDSDSSVSSRKRAPKSKTKIKSRFAPGSLEYIEERLCGRIFSGWVEERRWVESVGGYRDVIEVDEWELEMNQQLKAIISSFPGVQEGTKWINITPPGEAPYYCLWVLLEALPTPGHYWYTITGVHLQPQFGLRITVKEIRSIHPHDGELAAARRKRYKKNSQSSSGDEIESLSQLLQDWAEHISQLKPASVLSFLISTLTLSNIKESIRFLIVLLMTLVVAFITLLKESQVIGLKFIREAGIFFHNATPFLQTVLGFIEKLVGGLYLLVAMVYRDWRRPTVPPPPFPPPPPPLTPIPASRQPMEPRAIQYTSPKPWGVRSQNSNFT